MSAPAAMVGRADINEGARRLGIAGQPVCIHASLRSFPKLEEGPETVIEGLLDIGATVVVATMANQAFSIPAPPMTGQCGTGSTTSSRIARPNNPGRE